MIGIRFNMDGMSPEGRKVRLLDDYHIWCFIADPYMAQMPREILVRPTKADQAVTMARHFASKGGRPDSAEVSNILISTRIGRDRVHGGPTFIYQFHSERNLGKKSWTTKTS